MARRCILVRIDAFESDLNYTAKGYTTEGLDRVDILRILHGVELDDISDYWDETDVEVKVL